MKTFRTISILLALVALPGLALAGGKGDDDSKADRQARRAAKLAKFDANGDGKLDDAERTAMREARADARFAKLDTNNDGVITRAEFRAGHGQMHNKMKGKKHKRGLHKMKDKQSQAPGANRAKPNVNSKIKGSAKGKLVRYAAPMKKSV